MKSINRLTLTALFLALGLVLPFLTGQIPQIGNMLLPMHFPVFLCALICGWQYGFGLGLLLPLLRSFIFGMPYLYPTAIAMAFELAAYGLIAGLIYGYLRPQNIKTLYISLVASMIGGRIIWGIVQTLLMGLGGHAFGFAAFMTSAVFNAVPGIIAQLILIPLIMMALDKTKRIPFMK